MAGTFERQKTRTKQTTQVRPLFGRDLKIVLSPDKTISNIQLNIPENDLHMGPEDQSNQKNTHHFF